MTSASLERTRTAVQDIVRKEWGHVLASLVGQLRDFALAEDALQDAFVAALGHWPRDGVPARPRAWLVQTARRKAIDRLRREANFQAKRAELTVLQELDSQTKQDNVDETIPDERLRPIFTCCHPALAEAARVALTLRTLGGLTTEEIARAFLVPEATMAQRLTRAKRKIKAAGIPYEVPEPEFWAERLGSVLSVIYLIFNEGYATSSGEALTRSDLCREAIHLGRILATLVPAEPEAAGLLALMLLHESRRTARSDAQGNLITLDQQDRACWDWNLITAGTRLLDDVLAIGRPGPYQIQAAISALHAQSPSYATTDWQEITLLYGKLHALRPSPVVRLNAVVALSYAEGAEAAITMLVELEGESALARYQPFHAAHADMLRRAGRKTAAAKAYRQAITLTRKAAERRFLEGRLGSVLD